MLKEWREHSILEKVYFADFEAFTVDDLNNDIEHDPFLLCYS